MKYVVAPTRKMEMRRDRREKRLSLMDQMDYSKVVVSLSPVVTTSEKVSSIRAKRKLTYNAER